MIEVKHTPGPWEVECVMCDEIHGEAYEVHADGGAISIAAPPSEADAYLIAAAPKMFAALCMLDTHMDFSERMRPGTLGIVDPTGINGAFRLGRLAIADATGGQ